MTDIAADLRHAIADVVYMRDQRIDRHPEVTMVIRRLEALADAVEAKDPTAWGMVQAGSFKVDGSWRFPTEAHDD